MPITLAEAKAHMNITSDTDDELIVSYIEAASSYIGSFVTCAMTAAAAPPPVKHAVKMIVAGMYESREAGLLPQDVVAKPGPISVFSLISPYRKWVFNAV